MLYRVNLDGVFQGQDIILYARATSQLPNNLFVSFSLICWRDRMRFTNTYSRTNARGKKKTNVAWNIKKVCQHYFLMYFVSNVYIHKMQQSKNNNGLPRRILNKKFSSLTQKCKTACVHSNNRTQFTLTRKVNFKTKSCDEEVKKTEVKSNFLVKCFGKWHI